MSTELTFRRFIQIAHNKTKEEVIEHYKKHDNHWSDAISHVKLTSISPKLEKIKMMVAENMPKILVVDTLEDIVVQKSFSDVGRISSIVAELRAIASLQNIIVMAVSHIPKEDARGGVLDMYSGKGSSTIAQKSDKVIGIEGSPHNNKRILKNLKARDDDGFARACICDATTFRFTTDDRFQEKLNFK